MFEGLSVQVEDVKKIVNNELPFLALEKAMMWLTEEGVDRQKAHAVIRTTALDCKELQKTQSITMEHMLKDSFFDPVRLSPILRGHPVSSGSRESHRPGPLAALLRRPMCLPDPSFPRRGAASLHRPLPRLHQQASRPRWLIASPSP